jgi:putative hydrolase of the HAD superfamily
MGEAGIRALFLDIGGVLLSNGWDHGMRQEAARVFELDYEEMNERHHLTFDTYEEGKLSLDEYLARVVFYHPRSFTREDFRDYMFSRSRPFPEMIELVRRLKQHYGLKVAAVNNEGRELNAHRIHRFELAGLIDFFISSCYVHFRKPDPDIFRMALDVAQIPAEHTVYLEDRAMFVDIACGLGIRGILHTGFQSTLAALGRLGLVDPG